MLQPPVPAAMCVFIFSCAVFGVSSSVSLQPSCVLRFARSLGAWVAGNARDQGKARTACKGQQMVVKGVLMRKCWKKSWGVTE